MPRIILLFLFVLQLLLMLRLAYTAPLQILPYDAELNRIIEQAKQKNHAIQSWKHRVEASRQNESVTAALPDPVLSLSAMNLPTDTWSLNQEPMTAVWVNLTQTLPVTGKLGELRQINEMNTESISYSLQKNALNLTNSITALWYEWGYLEKAAQTMLEYIELNEKTCSILTKRFETGKIAQSDLLRFRMAILKMQENLIIVEQMRDSLPKKLNALIAAEANSFINNLPELPEEFSELDLIELQSILKEENITVKHDVINTDIASQLLKYEKMSFWPDLKLTAGYGFRQNPDTGPDRADFFSVGVGFNLPVFASVKQNRTIEKSALTVRARKESALQNRLKLSAELAVLFDKDISLSERYELYHNELIPQARSVVDLTHNDYKVGKADIDAVMNAEMSHLNANLKKLEILRDRLVIRSSIKLLIADDPLSN